MTKKVALYIRVSTKRQELENQRIELTRIAERHDWTIVAVYEDTMTGKHTDRQAFKQLKEAINRKEFDILMAWSVDRLGRSLKDLVIFVDELQAKRIDLYLRQQNLDTTTPSGKAFFQMAAVFAEFERGMISERVKLGLERAKLEGKKIGKRPIDPEKKAAIIELRKKNYSVRKIAKLLSLSVGTVSNTINQNAQ